MKNKKGKKNDGSGSFKKQLISGGVYIALAAAIVTVTMGSVSKIMNGDMGYVAPEIDTEKISGNDIVLPSLNEGNPVAVNPQGIDAKVEGSSENNTASEKEETKKESNKEPDKNEANTPKESDEERADKPTEKSDEKSDEETAISPNENTSHETSAEPSGETEYPTEPSDPVFDGRFYKVSDGYINREFSMDELIYSPTMKDFRTHNGIDITGEPGSAVRAFANGTVTETRNDSLMGQTVIIDHGNGITAYYMNLSEELPQNVTAGAAISAGDVIGGIGTTASVECADVSHVHLTIEQNGEVIDPKKYFAGE